MKLFRFLHPDHGPSLGLDSDGRRVLVDGTVAEFLTAADPLAWLKTMRTEEDVAESAALLPPVDLQEIWAAGVTYERSKVARMEESDGGGDFYDKVYTAERPELFFKSNAWRAVGDGDTVRIRQDSTWNVPEPELTLVVSAAGKIVGATVGNDMSSRSIEGENPLYLPQAKVYDGACAVGPAIRLAEEGFDLRNLTITLSISRDGVEAFSGQTSTQRMRRSPEELVGFLTRENTFPVGALLMTGTGLVPPDSFTLASGDVIAITIDGIGTLTNTVR